MDEQPQPQPTPPQQGSGFDLNQPTIISLLYIASYITGITAIVGVILAYVWKDNPKEAWEASHYQYLIRTFWICFLGAIIGMVLTVVFIGIFVLLAVAVLFLVRSVFSIINAQKKVPMPNPETWLA